MQFTKAGFHVFSNAKNHRTHPHVPLIVPLVNVDHLDILKYQRQKLGFERGGLICNSNCAVVGIVVPLAALQAKFGPIESCSVVTMQAVCLNLLRGVTPLIDKILDLWSWLSWC